MDAQRFDAFARMVGRRGLLMAALASAGLVLAWRPDTARAAACTPRQQVGKTCRRGSGCCSGRCRRKNDRRKGRCACSALLKPCFDNFDCCARRGGANQDVVCSDKDGFDEIVCCVAPNGQCQDDADCCSEFVCNGSSRCGSPP